MTISPMTRWLLAITAFGFASPVHADVKMSSLFGDHMVLQQDANLPIWGRADAGETVTVTLGKSTAKTVAGPDGKWRVNLPKSPADSTPLTLTVAGKNTLHFEDVLIGDVWVCSGQSNMEFGIANVSKGEVIDPGIRVFYVTKSASLTPVEETEFVPPEIGMDTMSGHWQKTLQVGGWNGFSAVGYFFAKNLHQFTGKPVGMIGTYWGGTPAQAWTSLSGLQKEPALAHHITSLKGLRPEQLAKFPVKWADYVGAMKKWNKEAFEPLNGQLKAWEAAAKAAKEAGQPEPPKPELAFPRPANPGNVGTTSTLFNGMINPLLPYAIKGVVWYQGEANAGNSADYSILFPTMIKDWREKWGQGDFPFLFVQLAGYGVPTTDPTRGKWALMREAQSKALALPNTGMATAIDVGHERGIHPTNKIPVGQRLALLAQQVAYGQTVVASGPTYDSMKVEGNKIRINFKNTGSGLVIGVPPPQPGEQPKPIPSDLTAFEIAGADQQWSPAKAVIDGTTVIVSSEQVAAPVAVRYAWADYPQCSLYSKEGLPAYPLRTDDWKQ